MKVVTTTTQNGIWSASSSAWTQECDRTALTFTTGSSIVNPNGEQGLISLWSGVTQGGTYRRPTPAGGTVVETGLAATFAPWTPTGCLWFRAQVLFTNITDTRWP